MTLSREYNQSNPDFSNLSRYSFELSPEDEAEIRQGILHQAESLRFAASPSEIHQSAHGIDLIADGAGLFEETGILWKRVNSLDAVFTTDNKTPTMNLVFRTPQQYDTTTLSLAHDSKAWELTPFDASSPIGVMSHDQLLLLLSAKLDYTEGISELIQDRAMLTDKEFPARLMEKLYPHANTSTDIATYTATDLHLTDAFFSTITARLTTIDGPHAIDYRLSIGAGDIPVGERFDPTGQTAEQRFKPITVANTYEHVVSIPHETGVPESMGVAFTVSTESPDLPSERLAQLAQSQRSVENAPRYFGNALRLLEQEHLDIAA